MLVLLSESDRAVYNDLKDKIHILDGYDISDTQLKLYLEFYQFRVIDISYPYPGYIRIYRGLNWEKIA